MSRLMMRRRGAPAGGGFSPLSIGWHTVFWADQITGLANGDLVATWPDSSGNGRHATQATSAKCPVFRSAAIELNGRPAVEFDGVDDFLATATYASVFPFNLVVVGRFRSGTGSRRMGAFGPDQDFGSTSGDVWFFRNSTVATSSVAVNTASHFIHLTLTSGPDRFDMDGSTIISGSDAGDVSSPRLTIGASATGGINGAVDVAFFGLVSALTTAEQANMLAWSRSHYGTP